MLPTEFWVSATLRRLQGENRPGYLLRRGDPDRGAVLVQLDGRAAGTRLLTQVRDLDGHLVWMLAADGQPLDPESLLSYVDRAVSRDPDLWVIEIETPNGETPFTGRVE